MTVHNPESLHQPDEGGNTDVTTSDRAPTSSFLQMFLEARPPRDDTRPTE